MLALLGPPVGYVDVLSYGVIYMRMAIKKANPARVAWPRAVLGSQPPPVEAILPLFSVLLPRVVYSPCYCSWGVICSCEGAGYSRGWGAVLKEKVR